jgi:hypothetical protein
MAMKKVLQVKLVLKGSGKPPIWRQVLIPADINFQELHAIIQSAMGWTNCHLHQFIDESRQLFIGIPYVSGWKEILDGRKVKISRFLKDEGDKMDYEYDFGDGWWHEIKVEKVLDPEKGKLYPAVIKGKGKCPSEDVGGIGGYRYFVEALSDPDHEGYEEMSAWSGEAYWDPHEFDLAYVDEEVRWAYKNAREFYGSS